MQMFVRRKWLLAMIELYKVVLSIDCHLPLSLLSASFVMSTDGNCAHSLQDAKRENQWGRGFRKRWVTPSPVWLAKVRRWIVVFRDAIIYSAKIVFFNLFAQKGWLCYVQDGGNVEVPTPVELHQGA
jgi:hypothetical protein